MIKLGHIVIVKPWNEDSVDWRQPAHHTFSSCRATIEDSYKVFIAPIRVQMQIATLLDNVLLVLFWPSSKCFHFRSIKSYSISCFTDSHIHVHVAKFKTPHICMCMETRVALETCTPHPSLKKLFVKGNIILYKATRYMWQRSRNYPTLAIFWICNEVPKRVFLACMKKSC